MAARILSTVIFWVLMAGLILGALVVVIFLYLPFVALKALWLTATGRLSDAIGDGELPDDGGAARPHIG